MDLSQNLITGFGNEVLATFILISIFSILATYYLVKRITFHRSSHITYYSNRLSRTQVVSQNTNQVINDLDEQLLNQENENLDNFNLEEAQINEQNNLNSSQTADIINAQQAYLSVRHYGIDNQCPICLIADAVLPLETNCGHLFCARCIINYWNHQSPLINMTCPVCRQTVSMLLQCFSLENENSIENTDVQNIIEDVNYYNRMFSQSRPWLDYIWDLPFLLRHLTIEFLNGGLVCFIRMRIIFCILIAFMYLISPLDIIPETIFGLFGLLDDILLIIFITIYVTIIYRRVLARRWLNE